jgi:transposase
MSKQNRRRFDSKFKTKIVLEALKEQKTLSVLSKEYSLHAQQITDWKKQAIVGLPRIFESPGIDKGTKGEEEIEQMTAPLYEKIGRLEVELDFLKKVQKKLLPP